MFLTRPPATAITWKGTWQTWEGTTYRTKQCTRLVGRASGLTLEDMDRVLDGCKMTRLIDPVEIKVLMFLDRGHEPEIKEKSEIWVGDWILDSK